MRQHALRRRIEGNLYLRPVARAEIAGERAADGLLALSRGADHVDDDGVLAAPRDLGVGEIAALRRQDLVVLADAGPRFIGAASRPDGGELPKPSLPPRDIIGIGDERRGQEPCETDARGQDYRSLQDYRLRAWLPRASRSLVRLKSEVAPPKLRPPFFKGLAGEVAEWSKAHAWNACRRATVSWVRIPPSPPRLFFCLIFNALSRFGYTF
jgi:hypothetical protein